MSQRLDIDALQALCAVVDSGGITRASEKLGLTQSAVSHKIKRLEEHIDCTLLTRRTGAPLLTQDGERLVAHARRILALHDEALSDLSKQPLSGKIRLGMTEDTTSSDLSRILGRFVRRHPKVTVRTHVRQSLELQEELKNGEIDLAIMQLFQHQIEPTDLLLHDMPLHWVKSRELELDFDKPLPFLSYDDRCFYKDWAMQADLAGIPGLETVLQCASSAGIRSAVQAGLGISILPEIYITPEMEMLQDGFPTPPSITFAIRTARKSRSGPVSALAQEIAEEGQKLRDLRAA